LLQVLPNVQRRPHPPQLFSSVAVFTQSPLHCEYPVSQGALHWLLEHTGVAWVLAGQTLPQLPQLLASVLVLMHAALHFTNPETQPKPHVPAAHVGVPLTGGMQTLVQEPQCEVLV
jgi:hypothetical protein